MPAQNDSMREPAIDDGAEGQSGHPGHRYNEEDEKRFAELFELLDRNKDGRIDVNELREGIERMGLPNMSGTAQVHLCIQSLVFILASAVDVEVNVWCALLRMPPPPPCTHPHRPCSRWEIRTRTTTLTSGSF